MGITVKIIIVLITIILTVIIGRLIDTFDEKEYGAWLFFGMPLCVVLFNYLNYREWKSLKEKVSKDKIRQSILLSTFFGIIGSYLTVGISEIVNAVIPLNTIIDEVVPIEKRVTSGRGKTRYVLFLSRKGNGKFEVEVSYKEYSQVDLGDLYRIQYKSGILGWEYKIGDLHPSKIRELNNKYEDKCN
jgi:hypothetical protein